MTLHQTLHLVVGQVDAVVEVSAPEHVVVGPNAAPLAKKHPRNFDNKMVERPEIHIMTTTKSTASEYRFRSCLTKTIQFNKQFFPVLN